MLSTILSVWVNGNGGFYECSVQALALALGLPVSPRNYPTICIIEPLLSYFVMLQRPLELESGDNPRFRPPLAVSISVYYVITTPIQCSVTLCYSLLTMLQIEALYSKRTHRHQRTPVEIYSKRNTKIYRSKRLHDETKAQDKVRQLRYIYLI